MYFISLNLPAGSANDCGFLKIHLTRVLSLTKGAESLTKRELKLVHGLTDFESWATGDKLDVGDAEATALGLRARARQQAQLLNGRGQQPPKNVGVRVDPGARAARTAAGHTHHWTLAAAAHLAHQPPRRRLPSLSPTAERYVSGNTASLSPTALLRHQDFSPRSPCGDSSPLSTHLAIRDIGYKMRQIASSPPPLLLRPPRPPAAEHIGDIEIDSHPAIKILRSSSDLDLPRSTQTRMSPPDPPPNSSSSRDFGQRRASVPTSPISSSPVLVKEGKLSAAGFSGGGLGGSDLGGGGRATANIPRLAIQRPVGADTSPDRLRSITSGSAFNTFADTPRPSGNSCPVTTEGADTGGADTGGADTGAGMTRSYGR
ncbi:hypothetical protein T492DRAFT_843130 [Pavlovales sp. CCMP2436]|nr:hypothetical protein T492DRAFT_843130 [Pavlovales sp. CCMP2436]